MTTMEIENIKNDIARKVEGDFPTLRDKIRAEKQIRQQRYSAFARLLEIAHDRAKATADAVVPEPMIVKDMMTGHVFAPVTEGVCGFAWVTVYPATSSFARWAKDNRGWSKAYGGGMQLWVSSYGQSYERKMAYARTFADVLKSAGLLAHAGGRLD